MAVGLPVGRDEDPENTVHADGIRGLNRLPRLATASLDIDTVHDRRPCGASPHIQSRPSELHCRATSSDAMRGNGTGGPPSTGKRKRFPPV